MRDDAMTSAAVLRERQYAAPALLPPSFEDIDMRETMVTSHTGHFVCR